MSTGRLFLIPTPLGADQDPLRVLPPSTIEIVSTLTHFVAENARTARAVLKRLPLAAPIQQLNISELSEHTTADALPRLLAPALAGIDTGLLSEAGCPAVADPGAGLVALAHSKGVQVVPLIGPSALLLALMASGMNGQNFCFAGYLPVDRQERADRLRALEQRSAAGDETVLVIETPYRTQQLFDAMTAALRPGTRIGIARQLSLADELVATRSVADWRRAPVVMPQVPTVFMLHAEPVAANSRPHAAGHANARPGRRDHAPAVGKRPPRGR
jgi:16S rRNA (cytidine1402-2'-O)-methyltransferase